MPILTSKSNRPRIGITLGDPSGVGPEVVIKSLASRKIRRLADFLIIGSKDIVRKTEYRLGRRYKIAVLDIAEPKKSFKIGRLSASCGKAAFKYLDKSIELLKEGFLDGLVTAPVNKEAINKAGIKFQGHTEYLAKKTNTKNFVMMLVGGGMRVALVTRHLPLKKVPSALTSANIYKTIKIVNMELSKYFGIKRPKIAVCSLNPHAGEGGIFGEEEKKIIAPAIERAKKENIKVTGPVPSDSLFRQAYKGEFDAVVAMYHDQGLGPLKMVSKRAGVNITLGLPFARTSPDHGTAFDIAGKNKADPSSMREAILLCVSLSRRKKNLYASKR